MSGRPTLQQASDSYYPRGFDESASLKRARRPYLVRNLATGAAIVGFMVGVYFYSISAVKQDDFSDVVDLLPPAEELAKIRTIEDEMRDKELTSVSPLAAAQLGTPVPEAPGAAHKPVSAGVMSYLSPRRLSEMDWVKRRGWVEPGKGNVIVWGAPNVDNIGNMRDPLPRA